MASRTNVALERDETMKSLDHQRVGEVFNEALERPADQRPNFLLTECGTDAELRAEVESLLVLHNESFLEENVRVKVLELIRSGLLPGDLISDRYKIIEIIGSGGMGQVYLAEDATMKRKVALKVLGEEFSHDTKRVKSFENAHRFAVEPSKHPHGPRLPLRRQHELHHHRVHR